MRDMMMTSRVLDAAGNDAASAVDAAPAVDAFVWSFHESFAVADGSPWPAARWSVLGGVASQSVQGGRGRLIPTSGNYALARMGTTSDVRDIDVSFRVQLDNIATAGVGYYVRQNGGWLRNTATHGQGYAVFVEGFRGTRLGVWREVDGQEIEIVTVATSLQSDVVYGIRFRVTQASATTTHLQARIWAAAQSEPTTWLVDANDMTPVLQNISGGMAVDSYSTQTSGMITAATYISDIVATQAN